jgi:hypothetical protein
MALSAGFTAPIVMQLDGWKTEKMMRHDATATDAPGGSGGHQWKPRGLPHPELGPRSQEGR